MATYKVTYFQLKGNGEVVRLALVAAGQKFEDERIEREKWPKLKQCAIWICVNLPPFGILEKHPAEKKELQELVKRKQNVESELKALQCELATKKKVSTTVKQSFEMKLHDILINTNPAKYLTAQNRPKEGVILADTYIIKKYYSNTNPSRNMLEKDADLFQTIVKSYEEKLKTGVPKRLCEEAVKNARFSVATWW